MTTEEKAKAYDEALERARLINNRGTWVRCGSTEPSICEQIFPELKESEDERIRKAIIGGLREMKNNFHTISSIKIDDAIAWLEKQGEQKPAWSEEDNKWIESLIQTFEDGYFEGFNQLKSYGVIKWLKSIKGRMQPKQECSEEDSIRLQRIIETSCDRAEKDSLIQFTNKSKI